MTEERCQLCGSVDTFRFVTGFAAFLVCRSCGEKVAERPEQPSPTVDDAINELTKLRYDDEDEHIHELGG